jgi:putative phage-type endonuclease
MQVTIDGNMPLNNTTSCVQDKVIEEKANRQYQGTIPVEKFQQERLSGIGGSDSKDYLDIPPYGCRRQLWYEKREAIPDYPVVAEKQEALFERGHTLEPIIRERYMRETGRRVSLQDVIRNPEHEELLYHPDGIVHDESRPGPGILECKTAGREVFYKMKRDGLPEDYIAQIQHGMLVSGFEWGSFAVLWPDGWQWQCFDIERDQGLIEFMEPLALALWGMVQDGVEPPRLDPQKSPQCQKCAWRSSCQGKALLEGVAEEGEDVEYDEALVALVADIMEVRDIVKDAEGELEARKKKLKELLGKRTAVDTAGARVYYRPQTSMRWDANHMAKAYGRLASFIRNYFPDGAPEELADILGDPEGLYKKPSTSRPLRIFAR